ncbi:MAG: putative metal-dependent hydrolase [Cytophagales bacterium]|nr:putative metal-dependent hydrolase [Cytophagales bacterium]
MNEEVLEQLRFPIGKFKTPSEVTKEQLDIWIKDIASFPYRLEEAILGLNENQLNTPYRPGGWTVKQVVHHCADSHMNSFTRFKLALTEENPTIKPYEEALWALGPDYELSPNVSISLLKALHTRWEVLLRSLEEKDFLKTFFHPESKKNYRLDINTEIYAWHGNHHLAHITELKKRMGW